MKVASSEIGRLLSDAARGWRAERAFAALVDSPEFSGIPPAGLMALLRWHDHAPQAGVSIAEFGRRYYCGTNVPYTVRAMVTAGLVDAVQDRRDGRRVILSLTAEANRLANVIRARAQQNAE